MPLPTRNPGALITTVGGINDPELPNRYGALPVLGEKWLAPQGPTGSAPGALLLANIASYGVGT